MPDNPVSFDVFNDLMTETMRTWCSVLCEGRSELEINDVDRCCLLAFGLTILSHVVSITPHVIPKTDLTSLITQAADLGLTMREEGDHAVYVP